MGNFFFKKKSNNYKSLTRQINQNYNADIDFNTSMELFDINNIENKEDLEQFKNEVIKTISNLQEKINNLEQTIEEFNKNLYKNNEQIDLIHKDLKSLLDNDKILNDKFNNLIN